MTFFMTFQGKNYKANLRDLIAVTSLVILLKLDSDFFFFGTYDLEIKWMNSKNVGEELKYGWLCYIHVSYGFIE